MREKVILDATKSVQSQVQALDKKFDSKIDVLSEELNDKIDALDERLSKEIRRNGVLIEELDGKISVAYDGIKTVSDQIERMTEEVPRLVDERLKNYFLVG